MHPMTAGDAAWYRMDRPRNETDILALLSFAGPVELARVQRVVEERLLSLDRFRERPVARWAWSPGWERDPGFSLRRHLSRVQLAHGALAEFLGEVSSSTLDPAHPLWRIFLVEEAGEPPSLVAKIHHALADGFALVAVLLALVDEPLRDAAPAPRTPSPRRRPGRPAFPGAQLLAAGRDAADFGLTLARLAALSRDPADLASAPAWGVRRVAWSDGVPLEAARQAARAAGATLNDLLLAAVAGGLRSRALAAGKEPSRVRALVPVNFRDARPDLSDDRSLGNDFGLVFVTLPADLPTARDRLDAIRAAVAQQRSGADALVAHEMLAACGCAPTLVHHALTTFFARKASLVVTNLPGPTSRVKVAGQRLSRLLFWVPHPASLGLGVSLVTYAGEIRVGVRADAAVVPEPADLVAHIAAELPALGVSAPAERREATEATEDERARVSSPRRARSRRPVRGRTRA